MDRSKRDEKSTVLVPRLGITFPRPLHKRSRHGGIGCEYEASGTHAHHVREVGGRHGDEDDGRHGDVDGALLESQRKKGKQIPSVRY